MKLYESQLANYRLFNKSWASCGKFLKCKSHELELVLGSRVILEQNLRVQGKFVALRLLLDGLISVYINHVDIVFFFSIKYTFNKFYS